MIHLNGNLLCAIDTETTGTTQGYHEIIQIAILPLGYDLKPSKIHKPFDLWIKPRYPERVDPQAMTVNRQTLLTIMEKGVDTDLAADLFDEWFQRLNLAEGKRISPLAHNWNFDNGFIKEWLGPVNYEYRIDGRYRDTMAVALFLNDFADNCVEQIPYAKVNLRFIANKMNLDINDAKTHDAMYDAYITAQIYEKFVQMRHKVI